MARTKRNRTRKVYRKNTIRHYKNKNKKIRVRKGVSFFSKEEKIADPNIMIGTNNKHSGNMVSGLRMYLNKKVV